MEEQLLTKEGFKFLDSHVHFYDMKHPKLHYGHWQPDEDVPLRELGTRNYLASDFIKEAQPLGMYKACLLYTSPSPRDS